MRLHGMKGEYRMKGIVTLQSNSLTKKLKQQYVIMDLALSIVNLNSKLSLLHSRWPLMQHDQHCLPFSSKNNCKELHCIQPFPSVALLGAAVIKFVNLKDGHKMPNDNQIRFILFYLLIIGKQNQIFVNKDCILNQFFEFQTEELLKLQRYFKYYLIYTFTEKQDSI